MGTHNQDKVQKIEVNGCSTCPFSFMYDMGVDWGCKIDKERRPVYEDESTYMPITPTWCPLKQSNLLIEYK